MKNAAVIIIIMIMIAAGGLYSYNQIKMEEFPNVDIPYLHIGIVYPGATPDQAMNDIGVPVQQALQNLKGLKNQYNYASTGYDEEILEMDFSRSMDDVERDVREALARIKFPDGAQPPEIEKSSPDVPYVYSFAVSSKDKSLEDIQKYVKQTLQPALQNVPFVDKINVSGSTDRSIYVEVDPAKLKANNLTLEQVKQSLIANNISAPVGTMTLDDKTMAVQAGQKYKSLDDIRNVQLIIVKQDMSGLSHSLSGAFDGVKQGFDQVQQGMNQMGAGMQTLGQTQALMQQEIQIINAIQGLSGKLFQDQTLLSQLQAQNKQVPNSVTPEQLQKAEQSVQQDQQQIAALQKKLSDIQTMLTQTAKPSSAPAKQSTKSGNANLLSMDSSSPSFKIQTVRLGDIANVEYKSDDAQQSIARMNGNPAVLVQVKPQPGANVVQLVKDVKAKLDELGVSDRFTLTVTRDQSIAIKDSVSSMTHEALYGALFAVIITLLFLRNVRATIVAIVSMPLSLFAAVIVLNAYGYTLNVMTLSGMAVAVGRVVDDSIVVIENIFRRIRASRNRDSQLVLDATREVGSAILSSTITTIAVFLPMTVIPDIVGKFFAPFAWTVVISLLFSLLVAVTVVPLFARLTLMKTKHHEPHDGWLQRLYKRILSWSLQRKWIVCLIAIILLAESGYALKNLTFDFLPSTQEKYFDIHVNMPIQSSLEATNKVTAKVEQLLLDPSLSQYIEKFQSYVSPGSGYVSLSIRDSVKDSKPFEDALRSKLQTITGAKQITMSGSGGIAGSNQFFMVINGPDLETIQATASKMADALKTVPGLADVQTSRQDARKLVEVNVDNAKAASLGISPVNVMSAVRDVLSGEKVTDVNLDGSTTDVKLQLATSNLTNLDVLGNQLVTSNTGDQVALHDIATLKIVDGPSVIQRRNQKDYVSISGTITGTAGPVNDAAKKALQSVPLPKGVSWEIKGSAESMQEGFRNITIAMIVSVLLVFVVMLVTFGEMTAPFAILFSLPFAVVGGFNGLWITHKPLGMPGMIGFLMLIGIIVTNAIVFMDRVEQQKHAGLTTREALLEAGAVRLRPILMTATATICALFPLAVSNGTGIISSTLAIVVIGGLTTSTLLTLVIVPMMYEWFDQLRNKVWRSHTKAAS
jgi:multidrug efflux pump subunit AcrB